MREYRFQASEDTINALRRLRGEWSGYVVDEMQLTIRLADGDSVRIEVDTVDVEGVFDAYRLRADRFRTAPLDQNDVLQPPAGFANGDNDVVLFSGASWSEPAGTLVSPQLGDNAVMQFSGHVGQVSDSAEIVCITTDAFVVATASGLGLLVRTGLKPESVEVVSDSAKVRAFLWERGYDSEGAVAADTTSSEGD